MGTSVPSWLVALTSVTSISGRPAGCTLTRKPESTDAVPSNTKVRGSWVQPLREYEMER